MVVSRDEPGRAIELHEETISFWKNGGGRLLGVIPMVAVPVIGVVMVLRSPVPGTNPGALVPLSILAAWLVLVTAATLYMLSRSRRLVLFSVNKALGEWVVDESSPLAFLARRVVLPLGSVERMELWTVRTFGATRDAALPLRWRLALGGGRYLDLGQHVQVHGLDKREEVLDLAIRFAHAAGLGHHRVVRNDHLELRLTLSRAAEEGSSPVPPLSRPAEYERDRIGIPADRLERDVPPFDPSRFASEHRIERWEPGKELLLVRPSTPGQALQNALGCGVMFAFATLLAWAVSIAWDIPAFMPSAATGAGLILYGIAVVHHRRKSMRGQVRLDWRAQTMSIERFGSVLDVPFDIVERIMVVGVRTEHGGGDGESPYTMFRLQVFARLSRSLREAMRLELIVETKESRDDPDPPYRSGLPFGIELARSLGVPCEYRDYK